MESLKGECKELIIGHPKWWNNPRHYKFYWRVLITSQVTRCLLKFAALYDLDRCRFYKSARHFCIQTHLHLIVSRELCHRTIHAAKEKYIFIAWRPAMYKHKPTKTWFAYSTLRLKWSKRLLLQQRSETCEEGTKLTGKRVVCSRTWWLHNALKTHDAIVR